jgi:hypothetical protein
MEHGMERIAKQYGIPIGLILIKLLVTLRTGIDTYEVSADFLDVLVIDGVYLVLWLIAAYSGKGAGAMALRPFAALGAWVLYGLMLYIAVVAGGLHGGSAAVAVSLIARVAGAVLLLYDTYDYLQALVQQRSKEQAASWKDSLRGAVNALAYLLGAVIALPLVVLLNAIGATRDYWQDNKQAPTRGKVVLGKAKKTELPEPSVEQLPPTTSSKPPASGKLDAIGERLLEAWKQDSYLSNPDAAKLVGLTAEAVRLRKNKYIKAKIIHVNGHGVEILQPELLEVE